MPIQEISAALWSSTLISPCMMLIDLTLHRRHQTNESIYHSLQHTIHALSTHQLPRRPIYWSIHRVYFLTFATANVTEWCGIPQLPSMALTTLINVTTMANKDRYYVSLWGDVPPRLPWSSRLLSATGALFTVYGQFVQRKPIEQELIRFGMSPSVATFVSSATASMAAQFLSTPLHLLSMDFYRYPSRTLWERIRPLSQAYTAVCAGRMLRVLPAFGGGGYLNEQGKRWKFQDLNK